MHQVSWPHLKSSAGFIECSGSFEILSGSVYPAYMREICILPRALRSTLEPCLQYDGCLKPLSPKPFLRTRMTSPGPITSQLLLSLLIGHHISAHHDATPRHLDTFMMKPVSPIPKTTTVSSENLSIGSAHTHLEIRELCGQ